MTIKTKEELQTQLTTLITSNTSGDNSASDIIKVNEDAIDSLVSEVDEDWIKTKNVNLYMNPRTSGDDEGINITGQLDVGSPQNPKESCFGEGDSTSNTMMCLQTDDDVAFLDVTDIFSSDSGSNQGMFNGTAAGKTLYVGSTGD
ncbi:unnamed protein product, partial [marine sediment metagenome]